MNLSTRVRSVPMGIIAILLPSLAQAGVTNTSNVNKVQIQNSTYTIYEYDDNNPTGLPVDDTASASYVGAGSAEAHLTINSDATSVNGTIDLTWEGANLNDVQGHQQFYFSVDAPTTYTLTGGGSTDVTTQSSYVSIGWTLLQLDPFTFDAVFNHGQTEFPYIGSKSFTLGVLDNTSTYGYGLSGTESGTLVPGDYLFQFGMNGQVGYTDGSTGAASGNFNLNFEAVPEPSSLILLALGAGTLALWSRKRRSAPY